MSIPRFGRWEATFADGAQIDRVEFTAPDGTCSCRPVFAHQPARLEYDIHGYEAVSPHGKPVTAVRFTPTQVGTYRYRALGGETVAAEGRFTCEPSSHPGFVEVSRRDPRYFAFTSGEPYCAIGVCLVCPPFYALPRGGEHFATSGQKATMGCRDYARWFRALSRHGGNFARIWLSHDYFNVEGETAGDLDLAGFARLDTVVEMARTCGIRLKLCIEHFRVLVDGKSWAIRRIKDPETGLPPADMDDWFRNPRWRNLWLRKVDAYLARYGDDPTVMAWELWNEINCCDTTDFAVQRDWTRDMLRAIKERSPCNLVTNSLGSFDAEGALQKQRDFHMPEMEFQQVHRYLDQGAPLEICRTDPVAFSLDAVRLSRRPDRPILLAETGGVNDNHTGPFRFYRWDDRGILFHDCTFPAFFAGAAGTGHLWHWHEYVDQKNCWPALRPFADLVAGVQLDAEGFEPFDLSTPHAWVLGLTGRRHVLLWVRNRADRWDHVLRDGQEPPAVAGATVDLKPLGVGEGKIWVFPSWPEKGSTATLSAGALHLSAFHYGLMLRIERG